jgi:hypothetical protein
MKYLGSLAILLLGAIISQAQSVLPDITVRELTRGKVQISWNNPHENCNQLAIQRSYDSVSNFRTIFSSLSPELPSNGYVDNRPLRGIKSYYRIFYVLEGGAYYFSKVVQIEVRWNDNPGTTTTPIITAPGTGRVPANIPAREMVTIVNKGTILFQLTKEGYSHFRDSINHETRDELSRINPNKVEWKPAPVKRDQQRVIILRRESILSKLSPEAYKLFRDSIANTTKDTLFMIDPFRIQLRPFIMYPDFIAIYRNDSLLRQLPFNSYQWFRDSIAGSTKDTMYIIDKGRIDIHPFIPKYVWRPSVYVFTNSKGYITVSLPLVKQHRYRIVFYDEDNSELFQIKSIKEPELVLDKANFMHAGWFRFELYEDDKLKEKNKFYLAKEEGKQR